MTPKLKGTFLILIAAFGYATVALFGKWIFQENLPMYSVLSWRFGGAALLLWIWSRLQKSNQMNASQKRICFAIGIIGDAVQTTLFFFTVFFVGASMAALLLYTFPFFVFLLQRFIFKRSVEQIQWVGLLLSFSGGLLVINPFQQISFSPEYWAGICCGISTAIAYACYLSFTSHLTRQMPIIGASTYLTLGACLGFTILSLFQGDFSFPASLSNWTLTALFVLIATVIPILSLIRGMQLIGHTQASLLFTVEPIITILCAALYFGEPLTLTKGIGSLLILGAALLIQKSSSQEKIESAKVISS